MSASQDFLMTFQRALKACQLYGTTHPRTAQTMKALVESYGQLLQNKPQVQIAARNGRLFVDKAMEDSQNLQVKNLALTLEEREIHALTLYSGATIVELQALLNLLCQKPNQLRAQGGAKKVLEGQNVVGIRILAVRLEDVSEAGEITSALLQSIAGLTGGSGTGGMGETSAPGKLWDGHLSAPSAPASRGALPSASPGGVAGHTGEASTLAGQMREYLVSTIFGGQSIPAISVKTTAD